MKRRSFMPVLHVSRPVDPRCLPPTTTVPVACELLGIGRRNGYQLVRDGAFPVKVIPLGGTYRVVTAELLRLLGISPEGA
jgi:hypothetical protein